MNNEKKDTPICSFSSKRERAQKFSLPFLPKKKLDKLKISCFSWTPQCTKITGQNMETQDLLTWTEMLEP